MMSNSSLQQPNTVNQTDWNDINLLKVQIVKESLQDTLADVLVIAVNPDLKLARGTVSKSVSKASGPEMQKELNVRNPTGIQWGEITETSGYDLQCRKVYHVAVAHYNQCDTTCCKPLYEAVIRCLQMADKAGYISIAFPAFGTGHVGYPDAGAAAAMLEAIYCYERQRDASSTLTDVRIVIYPKNNKLYEVFKDVEENAIAGEGCVGGRMPEVESDKTKGNNCPVS